jgi:microcin C transport system permease protein
MGYAFGVWFLSYLIGAALGAFVGYYGGKTDLVANRLIELMEMTPQLLLLITIISIFEPSMLLLVVFSVIFDWTGIFHHMRAQFLQLRKRDFVEAARALGASDARIIFKHIFPNALTPIVTFAPFTIAANISGLALLDYLGLGLRAPTPSWGELMAQAQKYFSIGEWLVWYPSLALLLTMTALINVGLGVRDAYDARL